MSQATYKCSQSSSSNPSPSIWANCPVNTGEKHQLVVQDDDFTSCQGAAAATGSFVTSGAAYEAYVDTGGTITGGTDLSGSIVMTSDTDGDLVALGPGLTGGFQIATGNNKPLWFEARLKVSSIADNANGVFVGLVERGAVAAAVPITAADAIADTNILGFHRLAGDGDQLDVIYKADGQSQQSPDTDAVTLVANTYVKVGFYFDGRETVKFYADGVELTDARLDATDIDAATFPDDVVMGPCVAICMGSGNTGTVTIDWIRCVQTK